VEYEQKMNGDSLTKLLLKLRGRNIFSDQEEAVIRHALGGAGRRV
jgi:hypothetical protein